MAEKIKPDFLKHLPKKENVSEPVSEPKQTPEVTATQGEVQPTIEQVKSGEINWNTIGLFSALISIIGTGVLFIMGWAYLSNWYSYYGISISQVNIQPQEVVIQSFPALVTLFSCLISSVCLYIVFAGLYDLFTHFIKIMKKGFENESQIKFSRTVLYFSLNDWLFVLGITVLFLLGIYLSFYSPAVAAKLGFISSLPYEMMYWIYSLIVFQLGGVALVVGILLFGAGYIIFSIVLVFQKRFGMFLKRGPIKEKVPHPIMWIFVEASFIIFITLALSAAFGINDASTGIRTGGFSVQSVAIVSPTLPDYINHTCDAQFCISGQYGLVGENANAYLLISLEPSADRTSIKYKPGVYIVPRSEETFIVPFKP